MTRKPIFTCLLAGLFAVAMPLAAGQKGDSGKKPAEATRADAYYHFALGHLYSELAVAYGSKGNFVDKAIDNYRKAMEEDPAAEFLSEELSDLYIQSGRLREAVLDAEAALRENPDNVAARRILAYIYTRLIGNSRGQRVNEEMVKKAIAQYEKIAELKPEDKKIRVVLGWLYKLNHESLKAEAAYKEALKIDPADESAMYGLAAVYANLGDQKRASEVLRTVVGKNPTSRGYSQLAEVYAKMKDYGLAAENYRKALELSPRNAQLKQSYAENLVMSGKVDQALKIYNEIAAENPEDFVANLRRSQILRDRGKLAEARKALDAAKEVAPDNLEVQYTDVNLLEAEGRRQEAINALNKILSATRKLSYSSGEISNRSIFLERLGLMYRTVGRYDDAVDTFRQLAELDPDKDARVLAQIADTYRQAGQFDKAVDEINKAYAKYPKDRMVGVIRASILADAGHPKQAIEAVRELTGGEPSRENHLTEAQIYEKTKDFDLMAEALGAALDLSQTKDEKATVLFMRGAMHERQKNFAKAETDFREVLRLSPDNPAAMNYLGYMFADRNERLDEALELVQKALEYEPNNGAFLDSLGWIYYHMDRLEDAENYLRRATQMISNDPVVHDHLGDVYSRRGKLRDAIAQWKASLKEWEASPASELDPQQIATVRKKLEGAEVSLAKESSATPPKQP